jgi:hypothetical protein
MGSSELWIESEFCDVIFGDARLCKRFKTILSGFMKKAQENISTTFENWGEIKSCYRFFSNPKVTPIKILQPHKERTVDRIAIAKQVLLLHDTTYIDYCKRTKTNGLDNVTNSPVTKNPNKGLILHNSLAISSEGIPLGIFGQHFVDRKELRGRKITKETSCKKPIESKESFRWIQGIQNFSKENKSKNIVHIADREADIYELYRDVISIDEQFLIRARLNRSINKKTRREAPKLKLFNFFETSTPQGKYNIRIQTHSDEKYRNVELNISYAEFSIPAPPNKTIAKDGENLHSLNVWGIMARESLPSEGDDKICWLLITNIPINSLEEAIEKIKWYSYRWNIELFHKILKSGCSIEKAQLRHGDNLKKYITMKSIIAWRLFWLTRALNVDKNKSCEEILSKQEWQILYKRFNNGKEIQQPPTVEEICFWIAKLGGYINRKSDTPPGIMSIWKGWSRFSNMITDVRAICG